MSKDAEVRWYIIRRVMQERTWGRNAVRMREESDSSAGRKPETICCWLPAVPPHLTPHLPFLLSLSPCSLWRHSVTYCQVSSTHQGLHTCAVQSQAFSSTVSSYFLLKLSAQCPSWLTSSYPATPHASFSLTVPLYKQCNARHKQAYTDTHQAHTLCERVSLMDSEDSNFPSATEDRKPSELNYPCLTYTRRDNNHTHTHSHAP